MFFPILIPLTFQLGIATLSSYPFPILSPETLASDLFKSFNLLIAIASIILISLVLYSVSLYIMRIAKEHFMVKLRGWVHGYLCLSRISDREVQNQLRGIIYAFAPIPVFFVLDIFFFRDHFFKSSHISFAAFAVIVYWHISKRFVREYHTVPRADKKEEVSFSRFDLSAREQEIANLLIGGKTNAEIGKDLFISENTVRSHIKSIYRKADVGNRVQLIHKARLGDVADN